MKESGARLHTPRPTAFNKALPPKGSPASPTVPVVGDHVFTQPMGVTWHSTTGLCQVTYKSTNQPAMPNGKDSILGRSTRKGHHRPKVRLFECWYELKVQKVSAFQMCLNQSILIYITVHSSLYIWHFTHLDYQFRAAVTDIIVNTLYSCCVRLSFLLSICQECLNWGIGHMHVQCQYVQLLSTYTV